MGWAFRLTNTTKPLTGWGTSQLFVKAWEQQRHSSFFLFVCVHWAEMKNVTDRTITERSQQLTDAIRRCCDTPITNTSAAFHKSTSRWCIMSSPVSSTVRFSALGPRRPLGAAHRDAPPPAMWARAPRPPHLIACSSIHRPHTHRLHLSPLPGYYCCRCRLWIAANCEVESNHIPRDHTGGSAPFARIIFLIHMQNKKIKK